MHAVRTSERVIFLANFDWFSSQILIFSLRSRASERPGTVPACYFSGDGLLLFRRWPVTSQARACYFSGEGLLILRRWPFVVTSQAKACYFSQAMACCCSGDGLLFAQAKACCCLPVYVSGDVLLFLLWLKRWPAISQAVTCFCQPANSHVMACYFLGRWCYFCCCSR